MRNDLSWAQVTCYLGVAVLASTLLLFGLPREDTVIPAILVWMLMNRKFPG
jgi:hypothetical protein